MSLFYWAWLGVIVYILFREEPKNGETATFGDFLQDAFGKKTGDRSETQAFVYAVYGNAGTAKWKTWAYLISASSAYGLLILFLCSVLFRAFSPLPFGSSALFFTGVSFIMSAFFLRWLHSKTRGNQKKRAANWAWAGEPNSPKTLPWWWLYQTTPVGFFARLSVAVPKAIRFYLALCVVLVGVLEFLLFVVKADPTSSGILWTPMVTVLLLPFWILAGAILPLDALVQLGDWRGDGVFSAAIATNELAFLDKA